MRYLIDTHVLLWIFCNTEKISQKAIDILNSPDNEIYVLSISFWEISIKQSIGKLSIDGYDLKRFPDLVSKSGFKFMEISCEDFITYTDLPYNAEHKDPFDRLIIHTAISHHIPLISADTKFKYYEQFGLKLIW